VAEPKRRAFHGVVILVLVSIGVVYYPTFRWLALGWVGNPYYRVGVLVPVISLLLAWRLQRGHPGQAIATGWPLGVGAFVVAAAMVVHGLALRRQAFLVSSVTLVFALAGVVLALAGPSMLKRQAFPLAFLFLALPLPWLQTCSPALTQWVAETAAGLGRLSGIPVTVSGTNLQLPDVALEVASPCTGVGSLTAFTVLAALYAFVVRGPVPGRLAFVVLAAPVALLASLARMSTLVGLSHYISVDFALRYYHLWSSALLFLVGYVFFGVVTRVLGCYEMRSDI
jgi:exosortase